MALEGYARQSFMESLQEGDRAELLGAGHIRQWPRGEALFYAGDRADSAIIVTAGLVKIHRTTAAGAEVVLGLSAQETCLARSPRSVGSFAQPARRRSSLCRVRSSRCRI